MPYTVEVLIKICTAPEGFRGLPGSRVGDTTQISRLWDGVPLRCLCVLWSRLLLFR